MRNMLLLLFTFPTIGWGTVLIAIIIVLAASFIRHLYTEWKQMEDKHPPFTVRRGTDPLIAYLVNEKIIVSIHTESKTGKEFTTKFCTKPGTTFESLCLSVNKFFTIDQNGSSIEEIQNADITEDKEFSLFHVFKNGHPYQQVKVYDLRNNEAAGKIAIIS